MEVLGVWEDVLNIVDDETGNDESRLFVQDDSWDGSQYIRSAPLHVQITHLDHTVVLVFGPPPVSMCVTCVYVVSSWHDPVWLFADTT